MQKALRRSKSWLRRLQLLAASTIIGFSLGVTQAHADAFDALEVVDAVAMDEMRGGFTIDGVNFGIGADVRTLVDGIVALQTQVTWSQVGTTLASQAGQGFRIGAETANAVSAVDATGAINVTHMTTPGDIMNLLVNTDSGRTFDQQANFTITLPGFALNQSEWIGDLTAFRIGVDLADAMAGRY